jgi:Tfp pilus assembly protein PilV
MSGLDKEFSKWWNADQGYDGVTNPYRSDSAVYWAWEGWQAAVKAEREACANVADEHMDGTPEWNSAANNIASAIRARGNDAA